MKRRDFLKGVMGAGALVAAPSLASANKPKRYSMHADGKLTTSNNPNFGLAQLKPEGMKVAYDAGIDHGTSLSLMSEEDVWIGDYLVLENKYGRVKKVSLEKASGYAANTAKAGEPITVVMLDV